MHDNQQLTSRDVQGALLAGVRFPNILTTKNSVVFERPLTRLSGRTAVIIALRQLSRMSWDLLNHLQQPARSMMVPSVLFP